MIQILKKDNAGMIEDLQFGSTNEMYVKNILKDLHPNHKVLFHKGTFSTFDFKVVDSLGNIIHEYELKSRRIKSNTYDSLMFGENKLRYVEKKYREHGGNYTFLWYCCFDNVLLGWDWEKGTTEFNLGTGQNKLRNEKKKKCVYVPTANMYQIEYVD
tara:strand:+ start:1973 stop:2443 length:471 start_codon:yes stop_codon:yes gene_type:complete